MPGTQVQPAPREDIFVIADRTSREIAAKYAHPISEPAKYARFYWHVMAGYGYRPYYVGMPLLF